MTAPDPARLHERNVRTDKAGRRIESALQVVILIGVRRQALPGIETPDCLQQTTLRKLRLMHRTHPKSPDATEQPRHATMPPKAHPPNFTHDGIADDQVRVFGAAVNTAREGQRQ